MSYSDYIARQQLAHQLAAALKRAEAAESHAESLNDIIDSRERDLRAAEAKLAGLVPDAKAIRKEAGGYAPVYSLQEQQLFIDGATWLRTSILRKNGGGE
jgi:hypothetical protein